MRPLRPAGIGNRIFPGDVTNAAFRGNRIVSLLQRRARAEHEQPEDDHEPGGKRKGTSAHADLPSGVISGESLLLLTILEGSVTTPVANRGQGVLGLCGPDYSRRWLPRSCSARG